ncbi:phage/plasmid replication protein [Coleofasciculus sp. LEGE 07081]|uniref:phage/plasmid replication domain-containing protein n=1 Tax=Coleofasciculus sp. LEGE 07081 TaxID=2777967 RepID=UPI0034DB7B9B
MRKHAGGALSKFLKRDAICLFISRNEYGIWRFRIQTSLPKLLTGNNFEPLPASKLQEGISVFLRKIESDFPELNSIDLSNLQLTRLDVTFDLPVHATPCLIAALRDCYMSKRDAPGWVYRGKNTDTFYSKDTRGKRAASYRSLIGYGKRFIAPGFRGLRLETRLNRQFIKNHFPDLDSVLSFHKFSKQFIQAGWKYIDDLFCLLLPQTESTLDRAISNAPEKQRDFLSCFGFLAQQVPLQRLYALFSPLFKLDKYQLKKYSVGFGNASDLELQKFAEIRQAWSLMFSLPYKNRAWNRISQGFSDEPAETGAHPPAKANVTNTCSYISLSRHFARCHRMPTQYCRTLSLRKPRFSAKPRDSLPKSHILQCRCS